ncbi:MAG: nitroreductase family protein [Turicibacter sp.]|nr:nitroreductase family protein [Turicibacter sp.]
MNFKELVVKNRSYRGFDENHRFTREELAALVDYARLAPSAKNTQAMKYFLAWENEAVDAIFPHTKWIGAWGEPGIPTDPPIPFEGTRPTGFIVIVQDLEINDKLARFQRDVGIFAYAITLAAAEAGIGGCMIGAFNAAEVKKALNLDDRYAPQLLIALGKPAEEIVLTEAADGDVGYYRDEANVHYVPKRKLVDLILN